jgi:hypothetical protein
MENLWTVLKMVATVIAAARLAGEISTKTI